MAEGGGSERWQRPPAFKLGRVTRAVLRVSGSRGAGGASHRLTDRGDVATDAVVDADSDEDAIGRTSSGAPSPGTAANAGQ